MIAKAQTAVSQCNWVVGECASEWTKRYARGRTDADFGRLVGLSPDQVFQRRRVFETFGDVRGEYPELKWSHFYVSLNWDDASECLQWAAENEATVSEMRAWRRLQRGEDLTEPPPDEMSGDPAVYYVSDEAMAVQHPAGRDSGGRGGERGEGAAGSSDQRAGAVVGVARETEGQGTAYAPFHSGAITPPKGETAEAPALMKSPVSDATRLFKKLVTTLKRCNESLESGVESQLKQIPEDLRAEFFEEAGKFCGKVKNLRAAGQNR